MTDLCTQTSGDRVVCAVFHYPQPKLPKASFTQEELVTKDTDADLVSTDFCETICSRGKTCKIEAQEKNAKSTCGLIGE